MSKTLKHVTQDIFSGQELVREYGANDFILIPPRFVSTAGRACQPEDACHPDDAVQHI